MEFDLTIENYSLPDLIQFFNLTPENIQEVISS
jgi:hypothetical protein